MKNIKRKIREVFFITTIFIVLFPVLSVAKNRFEIYGIVTDHNRKPLSEVTIAIKGGKNLARTGKNGFYHFYVEKLPISLEIGHTRYKSKIVTIHDPGRTYIVLNEKLQKQVVGTVGNEVAYEMIAPHGQKMKAQLLPRTNCMGGINAIPDQSFNTESYSSINENGFKSVKTSPLSTFSIDVDKASYTNVRRFLNNGDLPPKDAVRVEEMINYFNYHYENSGNNVVGLGSEYADCPWNKNHQLLMLKLKAMEINEEKLPASNLVFLVDVSGSMRSENKLPLVKKSLKVLTQKLRPQDKVAIVVYAGSSKVLLEPTPGSEKQKIMNTINELAAGGYTAGGEGLLLAYKTAEKSFVKGGNNRIVMATDGDFNIGSSSDAEMERLVEEKRNTGVFMTVLGFGMGNFKDSKLEIIANKGNGNYAYIDNFQEANRIFAQEFGGTMFTIAKDVKIQVEFNPENVKGYRLIGYENRLLENEDFRNDAKDAGDMGAGHTVTVFYEIVPDQSDTDFHAVDDLKYSSMSEVKEGRYKKELLTVKVRYKLPNENESNLKETVVKNSVLPFEQTSNDFRFASAVAQFGMLLRESDYLQHVSLEETIDMALKAKGDDNDGYRAEMISLMLTFDAINGIISE